MFFSEASSVLLGATIRIHYKEPLKEEYSYMQKIAPKIYPGQIFLPGLWCVLKTTQIKLEQLVKSYCFRKMHCGGGVSG